MNNITIKKNKKIKKSSRKRLKSKINKLTNKKKVKYDNNRNNRKE